MMLNKGCRRRSDTPGKAGVEQCGACVHRVDSINASGRAFQFSMMTFPRFHTNLSRLSGTLHSRLG